jgi:hypothetical protein
MAEQEEATKRLEWQLAHLAAPRSEASVAGCRSIVNALSRPLRAPEPLRLSARPESRLARQRATVAELRRLLDVDASERRQWRRSHLTVSHTDWL